jgi:hypothetical protein
MLLIELSVPNLQPVKVDGIGDRPERPMPEEIALAIPGVQFDPDHADDQDADPHQPDR